jgi:hypothetical protein
MAPLFEHYGLQLWMPEAGGRVDFASEHDEQAMTVLGLSSKREVTRTSIRVRTAMAVQTREQGRYLGGRPPYGYRLGDAGPHPNKAHAACGQTLRQPQRPSLGKQVNCSPEKGLYREGGRKRKTIRHAQKQKNMGIYCVREGGLHQKAHGCFRRSSRWWNNGE